MVSHPHPNRETMIRVERRDAECDLQKPFTEGFDMKVTRTISLALASAMLAGVTTPAWAQSEYPEQQTEEAFQRLMPISGKVKTMAGNFKLDHSFPAPGEAEKIYDLMDHQRASQLYLWGLPIVGMTRWHLGYVANYPDYDGE